MSDASNIADFELGKNMEETLWRVVVEVADSEFQRSVWLGDLPNATSSYVEAYHGLFDDINFDLIGSVHTDLGISPETWLLLMQFKSAFQEFDADWPDPYDQRGIIENPKWVKVVHAAQKALAARGRI